MSKKFITVILISHFIAIGVGVYGGMKYVQSKAPAGLSQANFQNLRNLSLEQRQQRLQQIGAAGNRTGAGFATGEIISKDDKSITIKLRDARLPASPEPQRGEPDGQGGSKIIFYSDTTEVGKFVTGSPDDLENGKTVTVNGKENQDGSITAQSIQLRPTVTPAP